MKYEVHVDELPKRCIDCQFCETKQNEPDVYAGMLFSSDEWDTYNECSLLKTIVIGTDSHCPLKLKK